MFARQGGVTANSRGQLESAQPYAPPPPPQPFKSSCQGVVCYWGKRHPVMKAFFKLSKGQNCSECVLDPMPPWSGVNFPNRLQQRNGTGRQSGEEEGGNVKWPPGLTWNCPPSHLLAAPLLCSLGGVPRDVWVRTLEGTKERKGEGASSSNHWAEQLSLQPRQY